MVFFFFFLLHLHCRSISANQTEIRNKSFQNSHSLLMTPFLTRVTLLPPRFVVFLFVHLAVTFLYIFFKLLFVHICNLFDVMISFHYCMKSSMWLSSSDIFFLIISPPPHLRCNEKCFCTHLRNAVRWFSAGRSKSFNPDFTCSYSRVFLYIYYCVITTWILLVLKVWNGRNKISVTSPFVSASCRPRSSVLSTCKLLFTKATFLCSQHSS